MNGGHNMLAHLLVDGAEKVFAHGLDIHLQESFNPSLWKGEFSSHVSPDRSDGLDAIHVLEADGEMTVFSRESGEVNAEGIHGTSNAVSGEFREVARERPRNVHGISLDDDDRTTEYPHEVWARERETTVGDPSARKLRPHCSKLLGHGLSRVYPGERFMEALDIYSIGEGDCHPRGHGAW